MKLIVGLGNPGRAYASNRHNIGFMCLNHFARTHGIRFDRKIGKARTGIGQAAGTGVVVARPQTYMNSSGQSVKILIDKFRISLDDLLVIHDDLDLYTGKIRIRPNGSSAGHKGIDSIITSIGSKEFLRIRVGIGRPGTPLSNVGEADIIDYVLGDFTAEERPITAQVIPRVSEAITCLLTEGLTAAMNKYN